MTLGKSTLCVEGVDADDKAVNGLMGVDRIVNDDDVVVATAAAAGAAGADGVLLRTHRFL